MTAGGSVVTRQWAIRTRDGRVDERQDVFADEQEARAAVWVEGGETVVSREVTSWLPVEEAR